MKNTRYLVLPPFFLIVCLFTSNAYCNDQYTKYFAADMALFQATIRNATPSSKKLINEIDPEHLIQRVDGIVSSDAELMVCAKKDLARNCSATENFEVSISTFRSQMQLGQGTGLLLSDDLPVVPVVFDRSGRAKELNTLLVVNTTLPVSTKLSSYLRMAEYVALLNRSSCRRNCENVYISTIAIMFEFLANACFDCQREKTTLWENAVEATAGAKSPGWKNKVSNLLPNTSTNFQSNAKKHFFN